MSDDSDDSYIDEYIERKYAGINDLPNLKYFINKYAKSTEGNDDKAIQLYAFYEGLEKKRALQNELSMIRSGGVALNALENLCGQRRKCPMGTYEKWALRMLMVLSSPNKHI